MLKLLVSVSLLALGGCMMQPKPVQTTYAAPPPRVIAKQPVQRAAVVRAAPKKATPQKVAAKPVLLEGEGPSPGDW